METIFPLIKLGEIVRSIRQKNKMNQVDFYRDLFPDKKLDDENIKKKMNVIENGKGKTLNYEFLFALHNKYDLSMDYLFGFETVYPNYENKAACDYTGLSPESVRQLHFWNKYLYKEEPIYMSEMTEEQVKEMVREKTRIIEAKWIFEIFNVLLQPKSNKDIENGISDLTVLYDIYMLITNNTGRLVGMPLEISDSDVPWFEKMANNIELDPTSVHYTDSMHEVHTIDIKDIDRKIWEERLLNDLREMVKNLHRVNELLPS